MTLHRFTRSAALALTVAALAAPTAARQRSRPRSYAGAAECSTPGQDLRPPDTRDYADGRGTYNSPDVVVVKVPEPEPSRRPAASTGPTPGSAPAAYSG